MAQPKSKSRGQMCCVYSCNNYRYDKENISTGIRFFNIPKTVIENKKLKDRWCNLIKRQDGRDGFNMTPRTVICHEHFNKADITVAFNTKRWNLKQGVAPSVFKWSCLNERKPPLARIPLSPLKQAVGPDLGINDRSCEAEDAISDEPFGPSYCKPSTSDVACQTDDVTIATNCSSETSQQLLLPDHDYTGRETCLSEVEMLREQINKCEIDCEKLKNQITDLKSEIQAFEMSRFSIDKISDDRNAMMFYTGFPNIETFDAFYKYIESKADRLNYWRGRCESGQDVPRYQTNHTNRPGTKRKFSTREELFMVLVRLKVGLFVRDIAERFGISQGYFSKIFTTWINFLHHELPQLFPFPSQKLTRKNMPLEFEQYSTTRVIIDCTEIYIEVPSVMSTQSQTWSSYKHNNTFKVLVGVSANGVMTYISGLWGGNTSDKEITKKCGILDLLEPGDNVMADRGFDIAHLLPDGVGLNIPPFLNGRNQLSASEVNETMDIASVRIHVEREIGRIKNYHILDGVMPLSLSHIAEQIVTVVAYLTNFLPPLLPPAWKVSR